jgi:DNA helicase-2/ATP-dependent DNA helicase PcrA
MSRKPFTPTEEQKGVIGHPGSAFISACPGAGKTQVLVERARQQLRASLDGKGMAFLSFTNAAISELSNRLLADNLLSSRPFPHYIGTFDTFLWQFFIAPFGIPGQQTTPKLIPDLEERTVAPHEKNVPLPLSCFDAITGDILPDKAKQAGYDSEAKPWLTKRYEDKARSSREFFASRGELSFGAARSVVTKHLSNHSFSTKLAKALSARFAEIIVDEAQDCNPADIDVINWLRQAGIATKVICDPNQSIYEFRGGVTDELIKLRNSFRPEDQLKMSGNFRSSNNICKTIARLRLPEEQHAVDDALGATAHDTTPVYFLAYKGNAIPAAIGKQFKELLQQHGLKEEECRVVSSTKDAAFKAIGLPTDSAENHRTLRLAYAVTSFHAGREAGDRKEALVAVHRIMLEVGSKLGETTYHQHVTTEGILPETWRPDALAIVSALRYVTGNFADAAEWLQKARSLLSPFLQVGNGTIAQKLPSNTNLEGILLTNGTPHFRAGTIHSVKGMEYPGMCVVMSATTTKKIIDYLTTGQPAEIAEGARKIYVGASRAERLLAIAIPDAQVRRLLEHCNKAGAQIVQIPLAQP